MITQENTVRPPLRDPDEINLLEYFYTMVKAKWWIIGLTAAGLVVGFAAALVKGPSYVSEAVIAPRESESAKRTPNLSGLGMFGGIVASQLNLSGNPGLDKIDIILDSKKFHAEMAEIYRLYPFIFPEIWDSAGNKWAADVEPPKPLNIGGYIKSEYIEKELNKNNTMTITITTKDSVLSDTLMSSCLEYLDNYIKTNIQKEAKENRDYLEQQLVGVTDPLLRGKIQELIAAELERMMVVSKEAFTVIDPKLTGKSFREKKLFPLIFAFAGFFLTVLFVVLRHAFVSGDKTAEDRALIENIREELRVFGRKKSS